MEWQYSGYMWPFLISALISGALLIYAWPRRRGVATVWYLMALAGCVTFWSLCSTAQVLTVGLPYKAAWSDFRYLAIVTLPLAWLAFAASYTGHKAWLTVRYVAALSIVPLLTLVMVATNEQHGLMFEATYLSTLAALPSVGRLYGPWFWVHSIYSYAVLGMGGWLLVREGFRGPKLYRTQTVFMLVGALTPVVLNLVFLVSPDRFGHIDITPIGFSISSLAFGLGLFWFQLLDLMPIARAAVVESMSDAVIVLDAHDRVIDLNPAAQQILQQVQGPIVGTSLMKLTEQLKALTPEASADSPVSEELTIPVEGTQRYFDWSISQLNAGFGRRSGRLVVLRDMTQRKQAEAAIAEKEQFLRSIYEGIAVAVFVVEVPPDYSYRFRDVNPMYARLSGVTAEEMAGQPLEALVAPSVAAQLRAHCDLCRARRVAVTQEYELRLGEQDSWWMLTLSPLINTDNRVHQLVGTATNITVHREYEQTLMLAKQRAEEMAALKDTFLANMSHEIRTPLTGIIGFANVLAEEVGDQHKEFAELIGQSGKRLLDTLNSVLDYARIESGQLVATLTVMNVCPLIEETVALFSPRAQAQGIALRSVLQTPQAYAALDPAFMMRILNNLVDNAIKFTESGAVIVSVEETAEVLTLTVHDTGRGISPSFLPHVFDEFRQESSGAARSHDGSGLGLRITKKLVEQMDGTIAVESTPAVGTTFTVTFPAHRAAEALLPQEPSTLAAQWQETLGPSASILAVDDHAETRLFLQHVLDPLCNLTQASDAESALQHLHAQPFDIVLLDIELSDTWTGQALLRFIREIPGYAQTPVLAMTGHNLEGDAERFEAAGFDGFLGKPFTKADVLHALLAAVQVKQKAGRS